VAARQLGNAACVNENGGLPYPSGSTFMPSPKNPRSENPTIQMSEGAEGHGSAADLHTDETLVQSSETTSHSDVKFGPPAGAGEVGTLGPYRILKLLGRGGMGAVYLAMDTRLNRKLAMKVMLPQYAADPVAKERFLREARATAQVAHDTSSRSTRRMSGTASPTSPCNSFRGARSTSICGRRGRRAFPR